MASCWSRRLTSVPNLARRTQSAHHAWRTSLVDGAVRIWCPSQARVSALQGLWQDLWLLNVVHKRKTALLKLTQVPTASVHGILENVLWKMSVQMATTVVTLFPKTARTKTLVILATARLATWNRTDPASRCAKSRVNMAFALHLTSAHVTLPGQVPTANFLATATVTATAWAPRHSTRAPDARITPWALNVSFACPALLETPETEVGVCLVRQSATGTQATASQCTPFTHSGTHQDCFLTFHLLVLGTVKIGKSTKISCQSWSL